MIAKDKLCIMKHGTTKRWKKDIKDRERKSSVIWPQIHLIGDLKVEEAKNVEDAIFKEIVDLNFPKMMKV